MKQTGAGDMPTTVFPDSSYEKETFEAVDLAGGDLRDRTFYGCTFSGASFQYANLYDCLFEKCAFLTSNLSLVTLANSRFIDADFRDSKLLGVNWSNTSGIFTAKYAGCILDNNAFVNMSLNGIVFEDCSLREASFINVKLKKALFKDCDLKNCQFNQADLSFADFGSSRNYYMNAATNKLHKTIFSLPEAVSLLGNFDITLT